jgi:cysteine-rich repeat protein
MMTRRALLILICAGACGGDDTPDPADASLPDSAPLPPDANTGELLLSGEGLYSDPATKTVDPRAIYFEPTHVLWSDGAVKRRWVILPEGTDVTIDTSDLDHWHFPVGTKFFKEFSAPNGTLLETREIRRIGDSGDVEADFFVGAFVWNEAQTDAVLRLEGAEDILGTDHDAPSRDMCFRCHRGEPGMGLGFSAVQLSRDPLRPDDVTLPELIDRGLLSDPPPNGALYEVPGNAIERAALGYIHANCGHCHTPGGTGPQPHMKLFTADASLPATQVVTYVSNVNVDIVGWPGHPPQFTKRIVAGNSDASGLFYRIQQRDGDTPPPNDQMPPIATEFVHPEGVEMVRDWIDAMAVSPGCGNGIQEDGEACDDGNTVADDGCSPACSFEALDCAGGGSGILLCPGSVSGNTAIGAGGTINRVSCDPSVDLTGPEASYLFGLGMTGAYTLTLTSSDPNLTLYVLDDLCNTGNCSSFGDIVTVNLASSGDSALVFVDGVNGASGDYTITCM